MNQESRELRLRSRTSAGSSTSTFLIVLILVLLLPLAALAFHGYPTDTSHSSIVPICAGNVQACTLCDIFILIQSILGFLWWVITLPLAALFLAYGGVLLILPYLGGPAKMMERGRKVIQQALVGVLIVLVAWLAIDTIIKVVGQQAGLIPKGTVEGSFGTDILLGPWYEITCTAPEISVTTTPTAPSPIPPPGTLPPATTTDAPVPLSTLSQEKVEEEEGRSVLSAEGISVNHTPCPTEQSSGCTNIGGMKEDTLYVAVHLKEKCDCAVTVTGGAEKDSHKSGEVSHASGDKIDISDTPDLKNYILGNPQIFKPSGSRSDGTPLYRETVQKPDGSTFELEYAYEEKKNHFDIEVSDVTSRLFQFTALAAQRIFAFFPNAQAEDDGDSEFLWEATPPPPDGEISDADEMPSLSRNSAGSILNSLRTLFDEILGSL